MASTERSRAKRIRDNSVTFMVVMVVVAVGLGLSLLRAVTNRAGKRTQKQNPLAAMERIAGDTLLTTSIGGKSGDGVWAGWSDRDAERGGGGGGSDRHIRKHASSADPTTAPTDRSPRKTLNVHVVPHTHDDVGWLKTVDQYYHGWNETIYAASVRDILDSVVEALAENPSRTFVYVETKFFAMWWREQPGPVRELVRRLVHETRQLSFANGGWCMHDEATTHFVGMIDQTTLGHAFLGKELGVVPTVGWQLDPFGHSSAQASLMTHAVGFDALYFGRIDHEDLALRHATRACEGLWNANANDDDDGDDRSVFWGLTGSYRGQYGSPGGISVDPGGGDDYVPLIELNRTALVAFVTDFLMALREQSDRTRGDHVMATIGEDFRYRRASVTFANLDLLLGTIARLQEDRPSYIASIFGPEYDAVNVFYSSPDYYTRCKHNETVRSREGAAPAAAGAAAVERSSSEGVDQLSTDRGLSDEGRHRTTSPMLLSSSTSLSTSYPPQPGSVEWPVKRDDFFPYSDCPHCFWTGYFTSRPSLKRFERVGSSFLLAVRQVESAPLPADSKNGVDTGETASVGGSSLPRSQFAKDDGGEWCGPQRMHALEDAIGVLQHHDGVSGTSKQHVAYDYAKRLQAGMDGVIPCTIRKLKRLLLGHQNETEKYLEDLTYCQLLNETRCDLSIEATRSVTTANATSATDPLDLYVVVYNSLASERSAVIDLPVGSDGTYLVEALNEDGGRHETTWVQAQPEFFRPLNHGNSISQQREDVFVLSFSASSLPAAGAKLFRIRKTQAGTTDGFDPHEGMLQPPASDAAIANRTSKNDDPNRPLQKLSNGRFSLLVDTSTGDIFRAGSKGIDSMSSWGYYISFDSEQIEDSGVHNYKDVGDDNDNIQNSGAYVFRPSHPTEGFQEIPTKNATIVHTSLGTEIRVNYEAPWIQTVAKLRTGMPYLEIEYQVGPIPIDDGRGKEVVTRYTTMVENHGVFYTDSNGREFVRRERNHRPTWNLTVYEPTAGNYYPINTAIYVDETDRRRNHTVGVGKTPPAFAVLTDRTQGGGSIREGTIELMVHRRTLADDARGVGEALNETMAGIDPYPPFGNADRIGGGLVVHGKHRILVEDNRDGTRCDHEPTCGGVGGARLARSLMDETFLDPLVFVGTAPASEDIPFRSTRFSGLTKPLPKNVMLVTKQPLYHEAETFLVRLGHQYGSGEDPDLSLPVEVDLSVLFPDKRIRGFRETTLTGNRAIKDWKRERLDWTGSSSRSGGSSRETVNVATNGTTVVALTPLLIRTFLVTLE